MSKKLILTLLCSSMLVACGSGDTTVNVEDQEPAIDRNPLTSTVKAVMPMHIINGTLTIQVINESKPLLEQKAFTGFDATVDKLNFNVYRDKMILVKLSGDENTKMYDPILDKYVPFNGTMHALGNFSSTSPTVYITPASEAVYQRALVRANQLDIDNADVSRITTRHFTKSLSEVNSSLNSAFLTSKFPYFSNLQSISVVNASSYTESSYNNLFLGLGYLEYWANKFPDTQNTYLEVATNFATDLRDGYLDGRGLKGDSTPFKTITPAPLNYNPQHNSLFEIGQLQKQTRENFGEQLRSATVYYATEKAFQNTYNPSKVSILSTMSYYTSVYPNNSYNTYRWSGAGDYRPAFGLKSTESCSNGINPCRQGLNADDLETHVNDVEYLIGTHQINQCNIRFYPNGDVSITRGDKTYLNRINRDLSDNLQQINNDPQNYILNVGASENRPAYFLQFEVKDLEIIKARTGYNSDIYSTSLETVEMDCDS